MRYHYEKPKTYSCQYGEIYQCNHPVYSICTLYRIEDRGLAVIQQRYNPLDKHTWWTEIDPWLVDELYSHSGFLEYFDNIAKSEKNGLYPTVTIRQLMWGLKMKPLKREPWESTFDKKGF